MNRRDVIISNGSNQFHMAPLAEELCRRGRVKLFIASGWPTPLTRSIANLFRGNIAVARFLNREEAIPVKLRAISNLSEIFFQIGIRLRAISWLWEELFSRIGFFWYSLYAASKIYSLRPAVYHYRACYGLVSASVARKLNVRSVCDHSIAHPSVLQYMVDNYGSWPQHPIRLAELKSPLQRLMHIDIIKSKWLLVNSDFVKKTCVFCGYPAAKIKVVYLGVDEKFFKSIPPLDERQIRDRNVASVLYVGGLLKRKGLITLAKAGMQLERRAEFTLIGGMDPALNSVSEVSEWLDSANVHYLGTVPRLALPLHMCNSAIFVFPSYREGSARVIFEAMACGCYIITTDNSGSIVESGIHGQIVPAGDYVALLSAIEFALENPEIVARIGLNNHILVRDHYRQSHYANNVEAVYEEILRD